MNEHQLAAQTVDQMSHADLSATWEALRHYDSKSEYAPGVPMDDWALLVASEISRRAAIERRMKAMEADIRRLQQIAEGLRSA